MIPQEAIFFIKECGLNIENPTHDIVEDCIVSALEKQTQKKPREAVQTGFFWCPDCKRAIKMRIEDSKINISYCPFCGQALDWGETE